MIYQSMLNNPPLLVELNSDGGLSEIKSMPPKRCYRLTPLPGRLLRLRLEAELTPPHILYASPCYGRPVREVVR